MQAVTFQAPGEVRLEEKPDPELDAPTDAVVRIEATGVCGSDLHIYHGRVAMEPGFTIGHEYVGTVVAAGDAVAGVAVGDRVLGCFQVACGTCWHCRRSEYHKCQESRTFGHGATLGGLQGTQAQLALVPHANLTLRRVPEGLSNDVALFAVQCALVAGASQVLAIDAVEQRLDVARALGAQPVHLTEDDPRAAIKAATEGRGVDLAIEAVGDPRALEMAIRLARPCGTVSVIGVYAERVEVHMGLAWIKSLRMTAGQANVIAHLDPVLALLSAGRLDPSPLVSHHMPLEQAPDAYALYDRREALKIVLTPN